MLIVVKSVEIFLVGRLIGHIQDYFERVRPQTELFLFAVHDCVFVFPLPNRVRICMAPQITTSSCRMWDN